MTTDITIDIQEFKDHIEQETRDSILYSFYIRGMLDLETMATVKGWRTPEHIRRSKNADNTGYME